MSVDATVPPTTVPAKTCATCVHWRRLADPVLEPNEHQGHCRRYPKTVIERDTFAWPKHKDKDEACGEHSPLPDGQAGTVWAKAEATIKSERSQPRVKR